jgi:hypothetical protein
MKKCQKQRNLIKIAENQSAYLNWIDFNLSPQHLAYWMANRVRAYGGVRLKTDQRVDLVAPQPQVAEVYYTTYAQMDRHNRCRQANLGLKRKVGTRD